MKEIPLQHNEVQLTSQHRMRVDKLNVTLTKLYQKRDGRGKNAQLIDEYAYDSPTYYSGPKQLLSRLLDKEFMAGMSSEDVAEVETVKEMLEHAIAHIDKVKEEIFEHVNDKIIIYSGEAPKKDSNKEDTKEAVEDTPSVSVTTTIDTKGIF